VITAPVFFTLFALFILCVVDNCSCPFVFCLYLSSSSRRMHLPKFASVAASGNWPEGLDPRPSARSSVSLPLRERVPCFLFLIVFASYRLSVCLSVCLPVSTSFRAIFFFPLSTSSLTLFIHPVRVFRQSERERERESERERERENERAGVMVGLMFCQAPGPMVQYS